MRMLSLCTCLPPLAGLSLISMATKTVCVRTSHPSTQSQAWCACHPPVGLSLTSIATETLYCTSEATHPTYPPF